MATFSINGVVQANYRYNALGQQVVRELTQAGQSIHAVHDMEGNRIAEYGYNTTTGASTLIRQYIWIAGRAVAVVEGGQIFFIRTDHIDRPVFATNNLGVKVWEASYLPFGGVHVATGGIDLRFPGQRFQAESGLHQNWMREGVLNAEGEISRPPGTSPDPDRMPDTCRDGCHTPIRRMLAGGLRRWHGLPP